MGREGQIRGASNGVRLKNKIRAPGKKCEPIRRERARCCVASVRPFRNWMSGVQLIEQRLQNRRVEAFGEPARRPEWEGRAPLPAWPDRARGGRGWSPRATQATPGLLAPRHGQSFPVTGAPWRGALPRSRCVCKSDLGVTSITRSQRATRGRFGHPSLSPRPRSRRGSAPTAREDR
jgi:hypothetical protein